MRRGRGTPQQRPTMRRPGRLLGAALFVLAAWVVPFGAAQLPAMQHELCLDQCDYTDLGVKGGMHATPQDLAFSCKVADGLQFSSQGEVGGVVNVDPVFLGPELTVGMRFMLTEAPQDTVTLLDFQSDKNQFIISIGPASTMKVEYAELENQGASLSVEQPPTSAISQSVWYNAVVVLKAGSPGAIMELYLDGVLVANAEATLPTLPGFTPLLGSQLGLGLFASPATFFVGKMGAVAIWNSALTSTQVADYHATAHACVNIASTTHTLLETAVASGSVIPEYYVGEPGVAYSGGLGTNFAGSMRTWQEWTLELDFRVDQFQSGQRTILRGSSENPFPTCEDAAVQDPAVYMDGEDGNRIRVEQGDDKACSGCTTLPIPASTDIRLVVTASSSTSVGTATAYRLDNNGFITSCTWAISGNMVAASEKDKVFVGDDSKYGGIIGSVSNIVYREGLPTSAPTVVPTDAPTPTPTIYFAVAEFSMSDVGIAIESNADFNNAVVTFPGVFSIADSTFPLSSASDEGGGFYPLFGGTSFYTEGADAGGCLTWKFSTLEGIATIWFAANSQSGTATLTKNGEVVATSTTDDTYVPWFDPAGSPEGTSAPDWVEYQDDAASDGDEFALCTSDATVLAVQSISWAATSTRLPTSAPSPFPSTSWQIGLASAFCFLDCELATENYVLTTNAVASFEEGATCEATGVGIALDGVDDYIGITNIDNIAGDATLAVQFYVTADSFNADDFSWFVEILQMLPDDGGEETIRIYLYNEGGSPAVEGEVDGQIIPGGFIELDKYELVVLRTETTEGTASELYIGGVPTGAVSTTGAVSDVARSNATLGLFLDGFVSGFATWDRALSTSEIESLETVLLPGSGECVFPTTPPGAPTNDPSPMPTSAPTPDPTAIPSPSPTPAPSAAPSGAPTKGPSPTPTFAPTPGPTAPPSPSPTPAPSAAPSGAPTKGPSPTPTFAPTPGPTAPPSPSPTPAPSAVPSAAPTQPVDISLADELEVDFCYSECATYTLNRLVDSNATTSLFQGASCFDGLGIEMDGVDDKIVVDDLDVVFEGEATFVLVFNFDRTLYEQQVNSGGSEFLEILALYDDGDDDSRDEIRVWLNATEGADSPPAMLASFGPSDPLNTFGQDPASQAVPLDVFVTATVVSRDVGGGGIFQYEMFLNGDLQGSTLVASEGIAFASRPSALVAEDLGGYVSSFLAWNRALTEFEILNLDSFVGPGLCYTPPPPTVAPTRAPAVETSAPTANPTPSPTPATSAPTANPTPIPTPSPTTPSPTPTGTPTPPSAQTFPEDLESEFCFAECDLGYISRGPSNSTASYENGATCVDGSGIVLDGEDDEISFDLDFSIGEAPTFVVAFRIDSSGYDASDGAWQAELFRIETDVVNPDGTNDDISVFVDFNLHLNAVAEGQVLAQFGGGVPLDSWANVTLATRQNTFDGTFSHYLYLNGVQVDQEFIGMNGLSNVTRTRSVLGDGLPGTIFSFMVWSRELSEAELDYYNTAVVPGACYNDRPPTLEPTAAPSVPPTVQPTNTPEETISEGLRTDFCFTECDGAYISRVTPGSSLSQSIDSATFDNGAICWEGQGAYLDGDNDVVTVQQSYSPVGESTILVQFRLADDGGGNVFSMEPLEVDAFDIFLYIDPDLSVTAGVDGTTIYGGQAAIDSWHTVVLRTIGQGSAATNELYLDGELVREEVAGFDGISDASRPEAILGQRLKGVIGMYLVWDRALTDVQLAALPDMVAPGNCFSPGGVLSAYVRTALDTLLGFPEMPFGPDATPDVLQDMLKALDAATLAALGVSQDNIVYSSRLVYIAGDNGPDGDTVRRFLQVANNPWTYQFGMEITYDAAVDEGLVAQSSSPEAAMEDLNDQLSMSFDEAVVSGSFDDAVKGDLSEEVAAAEGNGETFAGLENTQQVDEESPTVDASSYVVTATTLNPVTLAPTIAPELIPAPALVQAEFSDIGSEVFVDFDSPTDRAGIVSDSFPCIDLFQGSNVDAADVCSWVDDNRVRYLPLALVPGDRVSVNPTVALRARCLEQELTGLVGCTDGYEVASGDDLGPVTVGSPAIVIEPVVLINNDPSTSACDGSTVLEVTSSYNNGGRPFTDVHWGFFSPGDGPVDDDLVALAAAASSNNELGVTVDTNLLEVDETYYFTVSLTNFLGGFAEANGSFTLINDAFPVVSIAGSNLRTVRPSQRLEIVATDATGCDISAAEIENRTWSEANGLLPNLETQSNREQTLLLDAYTLQAGEEYLFEYTATSADGLSTTDGVTVQVENEEIFLDLLFCNQTVSPQIYTGDGNLVDNEYTLSAEFSFDGNLGPLFPGEESGLDVSWTAVATPSSAIAGGTVDCSAIPQATGDGFTFDVHAPDYEGCRVEIDVMASKGDREESQLCFLEVAVDLVPTGNAFTEIVSKATPNSKLVIRGEIDESYAGAITGTWTLTEGTLSNGSALADVALTSLNVSVPQQRDTSLELSSAAFDLVVAANSLVPKSSYTFRLEASFVDSTLVSGVTSTTDAYIDVTIVVNAPPSNGEFEVSPQAGVVLLTEFSVLTFGWVDDTGDLPLSYAFFCGNKALNPGSYASNRLEHVLLQQGNSENDDEVACEVRVADFFGAAATRATTVTVSPQGLDEAFPAAISALENADTTDPVTTFQVVAVAAGVAAQPDDVDQQGELQTLCLQVLEIATLSQDPSREVFESQALLIEGIMNASVASDNRRRRRLQESGGVEESFTSVNVTEATQTLALSATQSLVGIIANNSVPDVVNPIIADATENAVTSSFSTLLRSTLRNVHEQVKELQAAMDLLQRVRANALVAGEEPYVVMTEEIVSSTSRQRMPADGNESVALSEAVVLSPAALSTIDLADRSEFMLSSVVYSNDLAVFDDGNDTVSFSTPSGLQSTNFSVTDNLRVTVGVPVDGDAGFFVGSTSTLHNLFQQVSATVDETRSANFTFDCRATPDAVFSHTCPSGEQYIYSCGGLRTLNEGQCQASGYQCVMWNRVTLKYDPRDTCTPTILRSASADVADTVQCNCEAPAATRRLTEKRAPRAKKERRVLSHRRRLGKSGSDKGGGEGNNYADDETKTTSVDTGTVFQTVGVTFAETTASVEDLEPDDARNAALGLSALAIFLAWMLMLGVVGARRDAKDRLEADGLAKHNSFASQFDAQLQPAHEGLWYGLLLLSPDEVQAYEKKPLWKWLFEELQENHDFVQTCGLYEGPPSRVTRIFQLTTETLTVMVLDAAFFMVLFQSGDHEHCAKFTDEDSCEEEPHALNRNSDRCHWVDASFQCKAVEAEVTVEAVVLITMLIIAFSQPIDQFMGWVIDKYLVADILELADEEYATQEQLKREAREEREQTIYEREIRLMEEVPKLRPKIYRSLDLGKEGCASYPLRSELRRNIAEAVDLEFRLRDEEKALSRLRLRGSETHADALMKRRRAIAMIGIRDNMPIIGRAFFGRYTQLDNAHLIPKWQKITVAVLMTLYMLFCAFWVMLFAIQYEEELLFFWLVAFIVSQLQEIVFYVPIQVVLQVMLLPSLVRNRVMLHRLERMRPIRTLPILARNNLDLIDLCPGIDEFVPYVAALKEKLASGQLVVSPMKQTQRQIFRGHRERPLNRSSFSVWNGVGHARGYAEEGSAAEREALSPIHHAQETKAWQSDDEDDDLEVGGVEMRRVDLAETRGQQSSTMSMGAFLNRMMSGELDEEGAGGRRGPDLAHANGGDSTASIGSFFRNILASDHNVAATADVARPSDDQDGERTPLVTPTAPDEDLGFFGGESKETGVVPGPPPVVAFGAQPSPDSRSRVGGLEQPKGPSSVVPPPTGTVLSPDRSVASSNSFFDADLPDAETERERNVSADLAAFRSGALALSLDDVAHKKDSRGSTPSGAGEDQPNIAYGEAMETLKKLSCAHRCAIRTLATMFSCFLVLPEDAQIFLLDQTLPWTVGIFILVTDVGLGDDWLELLLEAAIILGIVLLLLLFVGFLERGAFSSVRRVRTRLQASPGPSTTS